MKLQEFIQQFPNARFATPDDNEAILDLYHRLGMQGGAFNIQFKKAPNYFTFLKYEAPKHFVLFIENDDGVPEGMAALALRPSYLDGRIQWVGHWSDLRFVRGRDRQSRFDWKEFMAAVCDRGHEVDEWHECRLWLGSFVMANERARAAFTAQDTPFDISHVASYQMVNLLAHRPFGRRKLRRNRGALDVQVSRATAADRAPLGEFLDLQNQARAFGYVFSGEHDELTRRLEQWDGFSLEDFFIARDQAGDIIGCFAPWDLSAGRRIVVDDFPAAVRVAATTARALGRNVPSPGDDLRILYMTTHELAHRLNDEERAAVNASLLDALYSDYDLSDYHMIALTDYDRESQLHVVDPAYYTQKTPTLLYQMYRPGLSTVVNEASLSARAGHEMCLT